MTLTIHPELEQRSEAWYDQRRGMVTASAVGQLLTPTLKVASNDTSRGLTAVLVAERLTGHTESGYVNADMLRGIWHETYAIEAYQKNHAPVQACGFMTLEGDGWTLGYSPDGLVGDDGLVEVKCPRAKGHLNTILADAVPAHNMAQLQAGLLVSGREWIDFISFHGGMPLFVKRVYPDPEWQAAIVDAAVTFENRAYVMAADYRAATKGLAPTERIPDELEMVI